MNPLVELGKVGQSVWLDYIRRSLLTTGELDRLIDDDGLRGMTSNPAIFEKAIAGSTDYTDAIAAHARDASMDDKALYESIAIEDIRHAADILRKVYDASNGEDGYVSLEVSPTLARDTDKTIAEARRLWTAVNRPNLMVKIPGTKEGQPAIQMAISEGINVNVTLLFHPEYYEGAINAYISGLEQRVAKGEDVTKLASVASFFVSRIDSLVDGMLDDKIKASDAGNAKAQSLKGKVAISNAKLVYQNSNNIYASDRWKALEAKGARKQRVLWASTSTKNPAYSDVLYVEELVGPDTVNTIPPATFDAFREHGKVNLTLQNGVDEAQQVMDSLSEVGVDFKVATDELLDKGIILFAEAFEKLLGAVKDKRKDLAAGKKPNAASTLDKKTQDVAASASESLEVLKELDQWDAENKIARLWSHDASLWTNADESKWMGWLNVIDDELAEKSAIDKLCKEVNAEGFTDVVLTAMGGSSLCPYAMMKTFGKKHGWPRLHVLDSTDPAQIMAIEKAIDIRTSLFIVSSKSGSTLEPNIFKLYFYDKVKEAVGEEQVGHHFVAITDPGSSLEGVAQNDHFRRIFHGVPSIGGRYSALSNFGMVPSALSGINIEKFLENAQTMAHACYSSVKAHENPGVQLGVMLGVNAKLGRDKVTLIPSPKIGQLGAWLEQLLAESTGKNGKGLIPVDTEKLGSPEVYSKDRVIAYLRLESDPDGAQDRMIDALEKSGQVVVRLSIPTIDHLGAEFFRWEVATAVAGSIIGINAFNQPDVEASKQSSRDIMAEYEKTGSLPEMTPAIEERGIKLFTDDKNLSDLKSHGAGDTLVSYLKAHYDRVGPGDYAVFSAFIEMNGAHEALVQEMRTATRNAKKMATCLGFGPRFLHSTGQAYKGGPNTGVFMQITCDDAKDLRIPDRKYTFGLVKEAAARGDFQVLTQRDRRAIRVHLGRDVVAGLKTLAMMLKEALRS